MTLYPPQFHSSHVWLFASRWDSAGKDIGEISTVFAPRQKQIKAFEIIISSSFAWLVLDYREFLEIVMRGNSRREIVKWKSRRHLYSICSRQLKTHEKTRYKFRH